MRKSTRSFALLLCIALFVCMLGTTTAFAYSLEDAEKVYDRTTTFNHVDIRVKGTITYKTYENGVETGSETKTVKISNPVITITRQDGKTLTKSFSNTTSYEWRWTEYNGRKLQINKEDSISLTCDITIDGVTKTGQHFSWAGKDDFVQAIYKCDGHQGLDFNVEGEDITKTFFYQVDYTWDNAPSSATRPTDKNSYKSGDTVNVDTTYKAGDTVTEDGYVYTFSGWTDYTPKGGSAVQLTAASFAITADTTVHGAWSKALEETPTPEVTPTPVPTFVPDPSSAPDAIPLTTPDPVDPPQTGDSNTVLHWTAVLLVASTIIAGATLTFKRKYNK